MQEEVENRTVNLAISTAKLSARTVVSAVRAYLAQRKAASAKNGRADEKAPFGRQTVKELVGQGQGVCSIDIAATDLRDFERTARKYGIGYAIRKDPSADPPRYLLFFRARDTDALAAAFREFAVRSLKRDQRPSVLEQLRQLRERAASLPGRTVVRQKKRELER